MKAAFLSTEQRVEYLRAFAEAVDRLPPEAWERLRARCADLSGERFNALVNRARLFANAHAIWTPDVLRDRLAFRAIGGALRGTITGIAIAGQLIDEFTPRRERVPHRRTASTGKPVTDAMIDAHFLIESALARLRPPSEGVIWAIKAAAEAVCRHDLLPAEDLRTAYELVEPEIPFATIVKKE